MIPRPGGSTRFTKARAGQDQRQQNDSGDQEDHIECKRKGPGPHNATLARHAVHDRDRVDEDIDRAGTRPQGDDEPDRDHRGLAAGEHIIDGRLNHGLDHVRRQDAPGQFEQLLTESGDRPDVQSARHETDGTGESKDQRWQRENSEERRLGAQSHYPITEADGGGLGDHTPGSLRPGKSAKRRFERL